MTKKEAKDKSREEENGGWCGIEEESRWCGGRERYEEEEERGTRRRRRVVGEESLVTGVSAVEKRAINVRVVNREIGRACVSRCCRGVGWRETLGANR